MSFKVAYSDVIICNGALDRVPEMNIVSLDPPLPAGPAARACNRWYKRTVRKLLEMHDWSLAQKRETLAESATNGNPGFTYCYEEPNDLAFLVGVEYAKDARMSGYQQPRYNFARSEGKIYTNIPNTVAVYTSLDITEDQFTEQFVTAVEMHMAGPVSFILRKDKALADKLEQAANAFVNSALANYRNQQGVRYGNEFSETDATRQTGGGYAGGNGGLNRSDNFPSNSGFGV